MTRRPFSLRTIYQADRRTPPSSIHGGVSYCLREWLILTRTASSPIYFSPGMYELSLERCTARDAREGDHITNILHSSDKPHQTLKTHSKARMWRRTILSQF